MCILYSLLTRICLCAHSATYDWSALINHFNGEINFCERRTNIICGYASHSLELEDVRVRESLHDGDFAERVVVLPRAIPVTDVTQIVYLRIKNSSRARILFYKIYCTRCSRNCESQKESPTADSSFNHLRKLILKHRTRQGFSSHNSGA